MKTYNGMDYLSRIAPFPLTFCSPGVQDSHQCPDRRDSRVVEAGKKFPCSALMEFFAFSHSGSEENLTKHPIRKAWQSYNAFGLCKYLGSLKMQNATFQRDFMGSSGISSRFRVSRFWAPSRANGWCRCAATWQLGSNHLTDHYFQHHIGWNWSWNDSREMKWPSLWICAATYTQRHKARHWGLTYLPKWRDPLEQWALGWSGRGQRLCRKWIASTPLNIL